MGRKNRRNAPKNDVYADIARERRLDKLRRELIKPIKPTKNYKPKNRPYKKKDN